MMKLFRTFMFAAVFAAASFPAVTSHAAEADFNRVNERLAIIERKQDEILRLLSEMKEELYKVKIRASLNA